MFTGLVEALGTVRELSPSGAACDLLIAEPELAPQLAIGDSIAVNGVCLTVIEVRGDVFRFEVGPETLRCTNLGELNPGDRVNLERAVAVGQRLGGHIVQGHVDGVGRIEKRERQENWEVVWFRCPAELTRQMVPKGSIAIDGISLTLVDVTEDSFSVALIPHTLDVTTLGFKQAGASVNLETDLIAKYVAKLVEGYSK